MSKALQCAFKNVLNINRSEYTSKEIIEILQECIDGGVDINSNPDTLVHAIRNGEISIIEFLVNSGINIDSYYNRIFSATSDLINTGTNNDIVIFLIKNGYDGRNEDLFKIACQSDNIEIMKFIFDLGIDPSIGFEYTRSLEIIELLVQFGGNISNKLYYLFRKFCKYDNNIDIIKYLMNFGVDLKNEIIITESFLFISLYWNNYQIKRLLLDSGMDPNVSYNCKRDNVPYFGLKIRPLDICIHNLDYDGAKLLLEYGADPKLILNIEFKNDNFEYNIATQNEIDNFINLFFDHGVDISELINRRHITQNETDNLINLLLDHGVDINELIKRSHIAQ